MLNRVLLAVCLCGSLALAANVTVRPGDTLGGIAARYNTSVATLMQLNGLKNQNITAGQQLRLPSSATITVQAGDTLDGLAQRHETTVAALKSANGLTGDALRPGQTLRLPGSRPSPSSATAAKPATTSSAATNGVYVVRAGDTLEGIAKRLGTSIAALKSVNNLTSDRLRLEQRLKIPGAPTTAPAAAVAATRRTTPAKPVVAAKPTAKPATKPAIKPSAAAAKPLTSSTASKPATPTTAKAVQPQARASSSKPSGSTKPGAPTSSVVPVLVTVQRGDTLYGVARRTGKSVAELRALNGLTSDALTPGQRLRVGNAAPTASAPALSAAKPVAQPSQPSSVVAVTPPAPPVPMDVSAASPAPTAPSDVLEMQQEFTIIEPVNPPARINRFERLLWPVSGILTSRFGYRWGRLHTGLDIAVPTGTAVYAALSGTVQFAGWNRFGYGYLVIVRGVDNRDYYYAHNSRLLVQRGQFVVQGRMIARSGSTGNSTGPHVHFEVRIGGVARNPIAYLPSSQVLQARYAGK